MTKIEELRGRIELAIQKSLQEPGAKIADAKNLAARLQQIDPRLKPRGMDDDVFADLVDLVAVEQGYLLPCGSAHLVPSGAGMSMTPISAKRAAAVARSQPGMRFALDDDFDQDEEDDDAQRFDCLADEQLGERPVTKAPALDATRFDHIADAQVNDLAKKSPGPEQFLATLTPKQRQRLADLNKRAAPIAQSKRQAAADFILDCVEQAIAADEARYRRGQ